MGAAMDNAERAEQKRKDAAAAIRFMAIKAAVFILVPVLVSVVMVWWKLG